MGYFIGKIKMSTCKCNTCSGKIEFEPSQAGQTIQCPHCGLETVLFIPAMEAAVFGKPQLQSGSQFTGDPGKFQSCPTCGKQISLTATSCPQCGHTFKYAGGVNLRDPVHVIGLGVCVLMILMAVIYILSQIHFWG